MRTLKSLFFGRAGKVALLLISVFALALAVGGCDGHRRHHHTPTHLGQ